MGADLSPAYLLSCGISELRSLQYAERPPLGPYDAAPTVRVCHLTAVKWQSVAFTGKRQFADDHASHSARRGTLPTAGIADERGGTREPGAYRQSCEVCSGSIGSVAGGCRRAPRIRRQSRGVCSFG